MRVFVAGGSGVLGRRLIPQLVARGHAVTATTTSAAKLDLLADLGAEPVVMDGLDADAVRAAVAAAAPDVVVHQRTAISVPHAGKPDIKHPDKWFAITNRLRSEGTDNLLAAARLAGVGHVVAQGYASWNGDPDSGPVQTEDVPQNLMPGTASYAGLRIARDLEEKVLAVGGAVLRYGALYGPGAIDDQVTLLRKRQYPLIGGAAGISSWIHLDDAGSATVLAIEQRATGLFNIVDDEPAPAAEWLPWLAKCAGAKPPMRIPVWLGRLLAGDQAVVMMTKGRGFANTKAKRELGWSPAYKSWRDGFEKELR
ncbi:dTDP-glucose 4,6-dehydratase [Flexivirga endophytica]|uniref:dTDP-glucose 4,6-dehydratase n=1 Tax=Flexivirga endophytica TaxID=1849103 RepID=A0A916TH88_9MICO|nr:NAD(P)-dependent oxidoreductase [Flexivirga endophytica]GGB43986.1 dTDP-glucose 4,6-dehydratase [Flexivirga endophytica]GHB67842.1 dTDP-glucose 4,6-dehydratase [Flexivirga endophytica]